jgi:dephospho-CoA kinase
VSSLRIALTGGIATGKSYCLSRFAALGVPVIDADLLAREALAPNTPGLSAVVDRFGASVVTATGALDRGALAKQVFADSAARRDLEAIVHPLVYQRMEGWFASRPAGGLAIADIPLLYETGRAGDFDRVIVAACPAPQQRVRLRARGLSEEEAQQRMAAQLPIHEKTRRADYVIETSGTTADTDRQVIEVWEKLKGELLIVNSEF